MMSISKAVPRMFPKNVVVSLYASTIIFMFLANIAESSIDSQFECSKTCVVEDCNTLGMRYGKYCGVGWSGCSGELPCDDLDACCQSHDQCVDQHGMTNIECHEECKRCINEVDKSKKVGFSNICPYDLAVPTLVKCMDVSILLSQFDGSKSEL